MPLPESFTTAILSACGALLGSAVGAFVTYRVSKRSHALERSKFISSWTKSEEVERTRIAAYRDLWRCLGGISTHRTDDITKNLTVVQERLQEWYYDGGGGLFLTGAAEDSGSTKSSFFIARDLRSTNPAEIWAVFHALRRSIRRDLGIFESEADEKVMQKIVAKKLTALAKL